MKIERGSAEIIVTLKEGTITIRHGQTEETLKQFKALDGSWRTIWEGINKAEETSNV